MRSYSSYDLLRFHRMAVNAKTTNSIKLLRMYNEKYPQLSVKEQMDNLNKALNSFNEEEE